MTSISDSIFARLLRRLARALCKYPKWFVYPQIFLFILCVFYTFHSLKIDMSRDNLVGANKRYHQNFLKFHKEFPGEDELLVVVESENMERNRQFVERLANKLEKETNIFTDVFFKGDIPALGSKALLIFPESDLAELCKMLHEYRPFIQEFTQATNLNSFCGLINKQFRAQARNTNREHNADVDSLIKALPALQRIVVQARESLNRPGAAPSPGITALFDAGAEAVERTYITFAGGRIFLATARAKNPEVGTQAVERMRALVQQTQIEVPGLNVGFTGGPVLEDAEMHQSEHDSIVATIASLFVCSFIFIYAYRQTGRPLKAVACLIIGLGYTMGFTTLAVGHLNLLTVTFAPILIGLAIDFGIHYITRYEEEMRSGRSVEEAVDKAIVYTGQGIITGALTTAGAFLAMGFTDFKGIQEMGIISGGGLILCLIPMMTMLPVLLMTGRQNRIDQQAGAAVQKRAQIENLWLERPGLVLALSLVLCAVSLLAARKVFFDYDLLHMQSRGLPAVVYIEKLIHSGSKSVLFAAVVADNPEEAREYEEKIKKLPSVGTVESMATYLTEDQGRKLEIVQKVKEEVSQFHFPEVDQSLPQVHELSGTLYSLMGYLGWAANEARAEDPKLADQLISLRDAVADLRKAVLSGETEIPERLALYQQALFDDLRGTFDALKSQDASGPLRSADLPPALRNRFVGITGKQLLQVYPKEGMDIWEHDAQRQFVDDIRSVIPEDKVTGEPVQLLEYTTLLKNSYEEAALYSLAAIALMVFFHFRSISCVFLALLPVGVGSIWVVGIMGRTGIPFNPANIMTLPLVVGIGVTNGIQILNRFAEEQKPGILSKSTGKAVLVSGLTAITGFGCLTLGKHQGIQSLGLVMSLGIAACMLAALTILPAILSVLTKRGWTVGKKKTQ